ncbi:MAG: radical SAM protein [Candidatus Bathyarchaeota archaeon]|nr:radical SAM protein [Candidatus Bathyarchaeota archaeon]
MKRYFAVMENDKPAKFLIAKKLPADFSKSDSLQELWTLHEQLLKDFSVLENELDTKQKQLNQLSTPKLSFLDLKTEIANRILESCHLCERRCGVNRLEGELGYCRCGTTPTVSTIFPHTGEEPELVPSGTIFTLGCTLRCLHCQNWSISQWFESGELYTPKQLAKAVTYLRKEGCRNVNLVGGDPTSWLPMWLEAFKDVTVNVPVVWNSNSYYSAESAKLLAGFADVYLLDFKYGPQDCATKISDAPNYWNVTTRNHLYAQKYGELIIRILVLPEHLECCTKHILEWITKNLGDWVRINLMFQYHPDWRAHEVPALHRCLTDKERSRAVELAKAAGLTNFIT